MGEEVRDKRSAGRTVVRFGWAAYQHVAGIFGAFSMAVFAGEVFGLGWRGILNRLVGVWDQFLRPPVKWVVDAITWPFEWAFDWRVEVPLLIRDYLAVGLVYWLSSLRVGMRAGMNDGRIAELKLLLDPVALYRYEATEAGLAAVGYTPADVTWSKDEPSGSLVNVLLLWLPAVLLLWPLSVLLCTVLLVFTFSTRDKLWVHLAYMVLPLGYLGVLLVLNYLVL